MSETDETTAPAPTEEVIESVKGFNSDWTCRGFQYEIGKAYEHEGDVELCKSGFHAISGYPLEVFGYYAPAGSRFAVVQQGGRLARNSEDNKIASSRLSVSFELTLPALAQRTVDWVLARIDASLTQTNTGDQSAATNTGNKSAATNTGNKSAATNTGNWSAATNTGDQSAATNTGDQSAATNTGNKSSARVEGKNSVAIATGYKSKVKGAIGCGLCLVYRDDEGTLKHIWAGIVGKNGIKAGTWYRLDGRGKPVEVKGDDDE